MFKSIPASQIVSVNPSVLSSGGSPLSLNAVFLSKNANIPTGEAMLFATAESVGEHFGFTSDEYKAAQIYFKGFDGSNKKPGRLYFYALNSAAEAGYLLGASVKTTSLAELKKIKGSLNVTIDGAEKKAPSIDLKSATSFYEAAQQIGSALSATVEFEEQLQAFKIVSAIKDHDKIVSSLFEAVVSAVAAAAVVERFLMVNQVWTCAIAGAFVGILTGHAMDTVKTLAPGLMKKWVKKTADKFIDKE